MPNLTPTTLDCDLRLNREEQNFLGDRRVALLEHIELTGSISQAARAIGMSYKAAWDAVETMNNLSDKPLVVREVGGTRGGGSEVTRYGRGLISVYRMMQKEYQNIVQRLGNQFANAQELQQLMKVLAMKTSARNQLRGTIKEVRKGAVNGDVILSLGDDLEIFANITNEAIEDLELVPGKEAVAIIKSSFIILSPDLDVRISARNRLSGRIIKTIPGAVNSEVKIELAGGRVLSATITNESLQEFNFVPGFECCALIKASHVIIAVTP